MKSEQSAVSRRRFLQSTAVASGGLLFGFHLTTNAKLTPAPSGSEPLLANGWIRISPDNSVAVLVNHAEMGNGAYTALPMFAAEELDLEWNTITVEDAPIKPEYFHSYYGEYLSGGSTSTGSSWLPIRTAAAKTRHMLIAAAAQHWDVESQSLSTAQGQVRHESSDRSISFGELLPFIQQYNIEPPAAVTLKPSSEFKVLGKDRKRLEAPDKVSGKAIFGIDFRHPDQLVASAARPPIYGGKVRSFNAEAALKVKGVKRVKEISAGVVVIADTYWNARKGRDALQIEWDDGPDADKSSEQFYAQYRAMADTPGLVGEDKGDAIGALKDADNVIEATYEFPHLAHAALEPLNCTALVGEESCEVWVGTQYQSNDQKFVAKLLGLPLEAVTINRLLIGGSFGRRASPTADFIVDSVETARGEGVPVQLIWSREEDMRSHYFRPLFVHKLRASLNDKGLPEAWHQTVVGQSIMQETVQEAKYMSTGIDIYSLDGCVKQPYAIPNHRVESHNPEKVSVKPLWWRSVGQSHAAYAYECFLDELAQASGADPYQMRLELCKDSPRMLKILELLGEKAGLDQAPVKGRHRGIASHESFGSYLAQAVELTLKDNGEFTVDRVCCVADCGFAVNPLNVEAQIQGGIVFGMTAAAMGEIEVVDGRVKQSNFHDYPVMRMPQMPDIDVHVYNSGETATGVGEPPTALIAPALGNALSAAAGERIRSLPFSKHGFKLV